MVVSTKSYMPPIRPSGKYYKNLTKEEQDCLVWYVLSGCKIDDAFVIFVRPDLAVSKQNLRLASKQFISSLEARTFVDDYKETLKHALQGNNKPEQNTITDEKLDSAVKNSLKKITSQLCSLAESGGLSLDESQTIIDILKKLHWLDDKEDIEDKPRRYLPETCSRCQYKSFVERNVEQGNIEDECAHCEARKIAEEHGYHFDKTNILNNK